jgi:hypothetical protein
LSVLRPASNVLPIMQPCLTPYQRRFGCCPFQHHRWLLKSAAGWHPFLYQDVVQGPLVEWIQTVCNIIFSLIVKMRHSPLGNACL